MDRAWALAERVIDGIFWLLEQLVVLDRILAFAVNQNLYLRLDFAEVLVEPH